MDNSVKLQPMIAKDSVELTNEDNLTLGKVAPINTNESIKESQNKAKVELGLTREGMIKEARKIVKAELKDLKGIKVTPEQF